MPVAREVRQVVALEYGVCTRTITVRRVDQRTGESTQVDLPCGLGDVGEQVPVVRGAGSAAADGSVP